MNEWNVEKVKVTLHLTPEAARILHQYAGERNRGLFVSQLLHEQRKRDDLERQAVAAAVEAEAQRNRAVRHANGHKSKKRR